MNPICGPKPVLHPSTGTKWNSESCQEFPAGWVSGLSHPGESPRGKHLFPSLAILKQLPETLPENSPKRGSSNQKGKVKHKKLVGQKNPKTLERVKCFPVNWSTCSPSVAPPPREAVQSPLSGPLTGPTLPHCPPPPAPRFYLLLFSPHDYPASSHPRAFASSVSSAWDIFLLLFRLVNSCSCFRAQPKLMSPQGSPP